MLMAELIEFIDAFSLESELFWQFDCKEEGQRLECRWARHERPKSWKLRPFGSNNWHHYTTSEVIAALKAEDLDSHKAETQLESSAMTLIIYADHLLKSAKKVLGQQKVERTLSETQAFLASFKQNVHGSSNAADITSNSEEKTALQELQKVLQKTDQEDDDGPLEDN